MQTKTATVQRVEIKTQGRLRSLLKDYYVDLDSAGRVAQVQPYRTWGHDSFS